MAVKGEDSDAPKLYADLCAGDIIWVVAVSRNAVRGKRSCKGRHFNVALHIAEVNKGIGILGTDKPVYDGGASVGVGNYQKFHRFCP